MPIAPGIFEIPYGTEKHQKLKDAICRRWRFSQNKMSEQYVKWSKMEDEFVAYVKPTDADTLKNQKRDAGVPQYTTIHVPYSYAQLLSAHTYWSTVFLSRSPIMQLTGRHGEAEMSVQAMESLLDYQITIGGMLVPLYTWLLDPGKYGFGVVGVHWDIEVNRITEITMEPRTIAGYEIPGTERRVKKTKEITGYEGNRLYNVRPYDFFPDPRVPIGQFQKGEFCGRYVEVGLNHILRKASMGAYYNIDALRRSKPSEFMKNLGSPRVETPNSTFNGSVAGMGGNDAQSLQNLDFYGLLEMTIELVPREWELGSSDYPEKWVFTLGNDDVIVSAQPLGYNHNKFPFQVLEYEIEGYGLFKRSMLETLQPMNDVLTWLFNSHFYNVRKVLNDQFVIDPSRIVMKDALDPQPGRMMRLKPSAYGTDPKTAIAQLQTMDVTQNNIRDAAFVMDLMGRMVGVNDNIMGMVNSGGRKSATEVRTSSTFGVNRLKTNSEYFSAQGFAPLSQMLTQNTQQRYSADAMYKIAGNAMTDAAPYMKITPDSIAGFYDYIPVDGTMPVDRFAQAALWRDLMQQMTMHPEIMMNYDLAKIFGFVAQLAGIKNLSQFKVQVQPAERLQQLAQMGNLIPTGGKGGKQSRPVQPGSSGGPERLAPPAPVPGVGVTQ